MEIKAPPTRLARIPILAILALAMAGFPAASASAAYPGEPGPIAYAKYKDVFDAEFQATAVGGLFAHGPQRDEAPRQLTTEASDSNPAYSRDGRRIAYDSATGGAGFARQIHIARADGSGARALTSTGINSEPYFSPDGRKLVFVRSQPERGISHLFLLTIATGQMRQLTYGSAEDREPVFMPSGERILFASDRSAAGKDGSDIWAVGVDGRNPRALIEDSGAEMSPDVSPDGRRIVFVAEKSVFRVGILQVARANGTGVRSLDGQKGPECRPCYSDPVFAPDGKHLAAIERRGSGTSLQVMRPDGTHHRQFDGGTVETDGFGGHVAAPTWGRSPIPGN